MALFANYPIALAPGMGENFFFVSVAATVGWRAGLAAVFAAGVLFLLLGAVRLREKVFEVIPASLKHAIAVGIGFFVAFIGLKQAGIIVAAPGSFVRLGDLGAPPTLLALGGLALTAVLQARGATGAILWGMLATTAAGLATGLVHFYGVVAAPPSLAPVVLQLDLRALGDARMAPIVAVFLFLVLFDTVGTLVGVGTQAGLMRDGKLERAGRAFLADAIGTMVGALLGTSTVTAFVESVGRRRGGRAHGAGGRDHRGAVPRRALLRAAGADGRR